MRNLWYYNIIEAASHMHVPHKHGKKWVHMKSEMLSVQNIYIDTLFLDVKA